MRAGTLRGVLTLQQVPGAVDDVLAEFFGSVAGPLEEIYPAVAQTGAALADFVLGGGKRVRPLFLYAGWRCGSSEQSGGPTAPGEPADPATVLRVGAAVELVQACALVHDDILDRSDTRRGRPTVHRVFEQAHREHGWSGDAAHHGASVAILIGDLALAWADDLVHGYRPAPHPAPAPLPSGVPALWSRMRTEVLGGQLLDIVNEASGDESIMASYRVMEYKTAAYTVARPLELGAALAVSSTGLQQDLHRIGTGLGLAFQLRDDLLGVFGDPAQTGKPSGDDLIAGKRTVLLGLALAEAAPADAQRLRELLGRPLDDAELAAARAVLVESGAVAEVERQIAGHRDTALAQIAELPVDAAARADLTTLAHQITDRTK